MQRRHRGYWSRFKVDVVDVEVVASPKSAHKSDANARGCGQAGQRDRIAPPVACSIGHERCSGRCTRCKRSRTVLPVGLQARPSGSAVRRNENKQGVGIGVQLLAVSILKHQTRLSGTRQIQRCGLQRIRGSRNRAGIPSQNRRRGSGRITGDARQRPGGVVARIQNRPTLRQRQIHGVYQRQRGPTNLNGTDMYQGVCAVGILRNQLNQIGTGNAEHDAWVLRRCRRAAYKGVRSGLNDPAPRGGNEPRSIPQINGICNRAGRGRLGGKSGLRLAQVAVHQRRLPNTTPVGSGAQNTRTHQNFQVVHHRVGQPLHEGDPRG